MRRSLVWLTSLLALLLLAQGAAAETLTMKLRGITFDRVDRICQAAFFVQSLDGEVPAGLLVQYQAERDGESAQLCTFIGMGEELGEWRCTEGRLMDCDSVGAVGILRTACLDSGRNEVACGPIVLAADDFVVDRRQ
jgi:hypothetical protein